MGDYPTRDGNGDIIVEQRSPSDTEMLLGTFPSQSFSNTTDETELLRAPIPANAMGVNGALFASTGIFIMNDSGEVPTATFSVKLGGTTLWSDVTRTLASNNIGNTCLMDIILSNDGDVAAQQLIGRFDVDSTATALAGQGSITSDEIIGAAILRGSATEDTTTDLDLVITAQLSVANAQYSVMRDVTKVFIK